MVSQALPATIPAGHVLMRVAFAGVNASDVNFTAGRYHGSIEAARAAMPLDAGFEAVGAIAAVGEQVTGAVLVCYWSLHEVSHSSECMCYTWVNCSCGPTSHRCRALVLLVCGQGVA